MSFQYENDFFPHNDIGRKIRFAKKFSSNTILEIVRSSKYFTRDCVGQNENVFKKKNSNILPFPIFIWQL